MSLLEIKDLSVRFASEAGAVEAVRNVSLRIDKGETVGIVGESGSGKSVSALSILRLLNDATASHPSGEIRFESQKDGRLDLLKLAEDQLRAIRGNRISMIFQEPLSSLNPLHTVERQIGEVLELHQGLRKEAARKETVRLLEQVGIDRPETRLASYPHQLSGGQRQRVMIAMALANEPELLIADEPTTALDVTIQAQILTLLKELQSKMGMALLIITHDLGVVRKIADRVYVMKNGEVVEQGDCESLFRAPQHDYTRQLLESEPKINRPTADWSSSVHIGVNDLKVWFPIKKGVLKRTVGHVKAVDGISLQLRQGQTVGVVGESGSGKTTLGRALLKLIPSSGEISFSGLRIDQMTGNDMRPLRKEAQIVFQDPYGSLNPRMTVAQIVTEGLKVHSDTKGEEGRGWRERASEILSEVGLPPQALDKYPHEFSGGERQRISIARAMILKPSFVVLDEPTSALDASIQSQVLDLLANLQSKFGLTYLFISHDLKIVRAIANEVLVMKGGVVVEAGKTDEVFERPQDPYTRELVSAALEMSVHR